MLPAFVVYDLLGDKIGEIVAQNRRLCRSISPILSNRALLFRNEEYYPARDGSG